MSVQTSPDENIRRLGEAAQVLLTCLRCVSMKRALDASAEDHLNFLRVYDSCLMDVAVISWCKVFGANKEKAHWERLLSDDVAGAERVIFRAAGGRREFQALRTELRQYRDRYVAHHSFDENSRPSTHPKLTPVRNTAQAAYREVHSRLRVLGRAGDVPDPIAITGERLVAIEDHWRLIARTAREAIQHFADDR